MSIPEIVSVAKAKAHLSELLKAVAKGTVYEVINRSEPVAILVSVDHYKDLLEKLEDLEDGVFLLQGQLKDFEQAAGPYKSVMEEYWAKYPEEAPVPWEQVKAEYWAGHLQELNDVSDRV